MATELRTLGKLAYTDTGAVTGSSDYTTVVMIHGLGFHSAIFQPMQPFAAKHNSRLVVVNRRDHPGSAPYTESERAQLQTILQAPAEEGRVMFDDFMRDRALEIHDLLSAFVAQEKIPLANGNKGGIVLVSWSYSCHWSNAFLLHAASFPASKVDLAQYIHRSVLYDPPYHGLGFPPPAENYHPLSDEKIPLEKRPKVFAAWMSGYYNHEAAVGGLEYRTPSSHPAPTLAKITPEQLKLMVSAETADQDGTDMLHANIPIRTRLAADYRARLLHRDVSKPGVTHWDTLPIRYLWCDHSSWTMPWGARLLREELDKTKESGRPTRHIDIVAITGANHFCHWDEPERLTQAILQEN